MVLIKKILKLLPQWVLNSSFYFHVYYKHTDKHKEELKRTRDAVNKVKDKILLGLSQWERNDLIILENKVKFIDGEGSEVVNDNGYFIGYRGEEILLRANNYTQDYHYNCKSLVKVEDIDCNLSHSSRKEKEQNKKAYKPIEEFEKSLKK